MEKEIIRCGWCGNDTLYQEYHDHEWGKVVRDEQTLFEFLVLESAQAGLSWITILRRRENYRAAFASFDPSKVALFTSDDVDRLLLDAGIIRHRGKIESTITNAQLFLGIQKEFGSFYKYLYSFMPDGKPIVNTIKDYRSAATHTAISDALAKDLKKRGFKFFGTVICYAFMQAVGMVNDHIEECSFKA